MKKINNHGITLVALIVTIVVLLIIAGVTLTSLRDEEMAESLGEAKDVTELDKLKTEVQDAVSKFSAQANKTNGLEYYINQISDVTFSKLAVDTYYVERGNAQISVSEDGYISDGKIDIWDGTSVSPTIDETNHEVHIYTSKELKGLADIVNSGNVFEGYTIYLENDLDFGARKENGEWETEYNENRRWIPIGKPSGNYIKAIFNGKNHFIKGLYVIETTSYTGLFSTSGEVRDLSVKDSYMKGNQGVGAIAGVNRNGIITNCHNVNTTVVGETEGSLSTQAIGGILGAVASNYQIENCTNTGYIKANSSKVGGIAGHGNTNATINNCINYGVIDAEGTSSHEGGIVGHMNSGGKVLHCTNYGNIINGYFNTGGVLGHGSSSGKCKVYQCKNYGKIYAYRHVGGVIGSTCIGDIQECANYGDVYGNSYVGGVQGLMHAPDSGTTGENYFANCYNRGNVSRKLCWRSYRIYKC